VISLVDLAPIGTARRDVIIHVELRNMPARLDSASRVPSADSVVRAIEARRDSLSRAEFSRTQRLSPPASFNGTELLFGMMPTYIAHVYHSTGDSLDVDGTLRPIYEPQSSFAYLVEDDGAVYGWSTVLAGATEYAPGWYHLQIPEGGVATVTTTITSQDEPIRGGVGELLRRWWWLWLLLLLLVIVIIIVVRRKKSIP
jgi:hypothetical protein